MPSSLARYSSGESWLDKIRGSGKSHSSSINKGVEAGLAVRQIGEGALVAAILSWASSKYGADVKITSSSPSIPVDLSVGALGILSALMLADQEVAHDLRNVATAGVTIFTYRKIQDLMKSNRATISGEPLFGNRIEAENPIIAMSRLMKQ